MTFTTNKISLLGSSLSTETSVSAPSTAPIASSKKSECQNLFSSTGPFDVNPPLVSKKVT